MASFSPCSSNKGPATPEGQPWEPTPPHHFYRSLIPKDCSLWPAMSTAQASAGRPAPHAGQPHDLATYPLQPPVRP